jgi:predicted O-methyltransferase YrrM
MWKTDSRIFQTFAPPNLRRPDRLHPAFIKMDYCTDHTTPAPWPLPDLERETHLRTLSPQMLSGPLQGRLLHFLCQMLRPRRVLEIGTFTGYTAIYMALALPDDGCLHTIEVNDELGWIIRKYVELAGVQDKVRLHLGDVADILPALDETFDLTFMDAGKMDYLQHYEWALAKTRSGGFIVADNVLWDGKVVAGAADATTQALRAFNDFVHADERVDNLLLPLRDGLLLMRKR